ncbi:BMP family protein [Enterococcus saccharolyticus]|uniref:BMP family ABC transporter substrate-binding protein n=1 Tax=Candidatus Enterococcus willemsii TaxID=1857215 RepID=A0ABQ6YWJ7_9ENTE|nr:MULTISPECIES: BMP family protein [Enterococcus]KAF1302064.1 BMP family ABC transporter substrate-binding protein [Enterococcus sp. CU12B]MCD5002827.1 BMP family protein [Enterococcus saccharolyticus]
MKKNKFAKLALATAGILAILSGCGNGGTDSSASSSSSAASDAPSVALITDGNGVDDRSFNQSAWEGMVSYGKENGLEQGNGGYQYFQSSGESDFIPNIDQALTAGYQTIFGIGFKLQAAIQEQATANPEVNFVIVDELVEDLDNVVSATFKSNEAAYLAGVAAAYSTKSDVVGFLGGMEISLIQAFEAGFKQGVADASKALGKDIKVVSQYAGDFSAPDKGRTIASAIYAKGADIIYGAAGATGNGLFQEAKSLNETKDEKVWVIGVDRDQTEEGNYKKDGKEDNFTLTSTLKEVGAAVKDLAEKAAKDEFPGGEHIVYGLDENGVGLTDGQLSDEAKAAVKEAREKIISGEITVKDAL